jgi:hypothetical protein
MLVENQNSKINSLKVNGMKNFIFVFSFMDFFSSCKKGHDKPSLHLSAGELMLESGTNTSESRTTYAIT